MASTFKSLFGKIGSGTPTTVYTVPANTTAIAIGMTVANVHSSGGTNIGVSVAVVDAGGNAYHIIRSATVEPGQSMVVIGGNQKIVLNAGSRVTVQSTAASSADVILSVLEV